MASLNPRSSGRRNQPYSRNRLTRSNSSFLGTIKTIVTAPLAWFASPDDFDDEKDLGEKRRRISPSHAIRESLTSDDRHLRTKRIRVDSPPKDTPAALPNTGYLDPPNTLFKQQYSVPALTRRFAAFSTRDASSDDPASSKPVFPFRSVSHTVPLEQQQRSPARDITSETSVRAGPLQASPQAEKQTTMRELSMPPMSSRAPFRLRGSLTPQPQPRELSEPPALNSLSNKPVFVRGPPSDVDAGSPQQPSATLGSLLESNQPARSPSQSRSLLLGNSPPAQGRHPQPAEKALQELDVYKTPLLPSRLRSTASFIASPEGPDLFKSRRKTQLVLMQDDEDRSKPGRKNKSRETLNETKPYAGEGGMRKLLARRKQEETPEAATEPDPDRNETNKNKLVPVADLDEKDLSSMSKPLTWYEMAETAPSHGSSSLRVGRNKSSRMHIARPVSRPGKSTFSASFEDDVDDSMDNSAKIPTGDSSDKLRVKAVFEAPRDFTFANKAGPIAFARGNAKEPPIPTLPFSLVSTPEPSLPSVDPFPSSSMAPPMSQSVESDAPLNKKPTVDLSSVNEPPAQPPPAVGIPNFFASSTAFNKPLTISLPSLNFPLIPTEVKETPKPAVSTQPNTIENHAKGGLALSKEQLQEPTANNSARHRFGDSTTETGTPKSSLPAKEMPPAQTVVSQEGPALTPTLDSHSSTPPATSVNPHSYTGSASNSAINKELELAIIDKPTLPNVSLDTPFNRPLAATPQPPLAKSPPFAFNSRGMGMMPASQTGNAHVGQVEKPIVSNATHTEPKRPSLFSPSIPAPSDYSNTPISSIAGRLPGTSDFVKQSNSATNTVSSETPLGVTEAPTTKDSFAPISSMGSMDSDAKPPSFSFTPNSSAFSFGPGTSQTGKAVEPFSFSATRPVARAATPPTMADQEVQMDESPSGEMQINGTKREEKTHDMSFSFASTPPVQFAQSNQPSASTESPFSFKSSNAFSGPFATPVNSEKPSTSQPFSFSPLPAPSFSFGQTKPVDSNSNTAAFSFNTPTTPVTPAAPTPFSFNTPAPPSPLFVQTQIQPGSAPASPSTLTPAPFGFSTPKPSTNAPFTFGSSQPASPAGAVTPLPQPHSGFPGMLSQSSTPTSPFSPAPPSGGALFTIGAPPPSGTSLSPGARQIRKLPTRRAGVKR